MKKFFVTFGQKYRDLKHPIFGGIHPDGYITIESESKEAAQIMVREVFKNDYSMVYSEEEVKPETLQRNFPVGNLKTITVKNFQSENLWN